MTEFILGYLFFASCMFAASYYSCSDIFDPDNHNLFGLLLVSLLWPWFLVTCLFQKIIK